LVAGQEQSIPGVDLTLVTMRFGDKIRLIIPYEYGFGKYDNPHGFHGSNILIPGRSTLYFGEIHLINPDLAKPKSSSEWLAIAETQKNEGNTFFQEKKWNLALKRYNKALKTLSDIATNMDIPYKFPPDMKEEDIQKKKEEDKSNREKLNTQRVTCYSNVAACHLMKQEYQKTKEYCNLALEIDTNHVKSLWRLSKVHYALIDYDLCLKTLLAAQQITDTKEIQKEIFMVRKAIVQKKESDTKTYGGFFNKFGAEGLYEGVEAKPARWTCHVCHEEMDDIQKARHYIKRHGEPKKDIFL